MMNGEAEVVEEEGGGAEEAAEQWRPWSPQEDAILSGLVSEFGARDWSLIARGIPGRSELSCCFRWCNKLDPSVERKPSTDDIFDIPKDTHEAILNSKLSAVFVWEDQEFSISTRTKVLRTGTTPKMDIVCSVGEIIFGSDILRKVEGSNISVEGGDIDRGFWVWHPLGDIYRRIPMPEDYGLECGLIRFFQESSKDHLGFYKRETWKMRSERIQFGFGKCLNANTYKIVIIFEVVRGYTVRTQRSHVYTLGRKGASWRAIEPFSSMFQFETDSRPAYFKGRVHWIAECFAYQHSPDNGCRLLTFDIETERFGSIDLPFLGTVAGQLTVTAFHDSLRVARTYSDGSGLQIWSMADYADEESWFLEHDISAEGSINFIFAAPLCYPVAWIKKDVLVVTDGIGVLEYNQASKTVKRVDYLEHYQKSSGPFAWLANLHQKAVAYTTSLSEIVRFL